MSRLRICYISDWASVHCQRWATAMAGRGHNVIVVTPYAGAQPRPAGAVPVVVRPLYPFGARALMRPLHALLNCVSFRRFLARSAPDVIHLMGLFPVLHPMLTPTVSRLSRLVVSTWGADIVWDPPKDEPLSKEPFLSVWTKKFILRQARAITATSRFQVAVTQEYAPPWLTVRHIPYGVDLGLFNPERYPKRPDGPLFIAYVKSVAPKYGPDVALAAFRIVKSEIRHAGMIMAGDGPMLASLKRTAADSRLDDAVRFLGRVGHEEVPAVLASADLLVMPSVCEETFGVVALEAAAMGLPVIASKVGGVSEVVVDGVTGLLVPPGDEKTLARAIIELARDRARMKAMGRAGREFVAKTYSWDRCVDQMEEVYLQVARGKADRG
ncbi:MAG: glycosyltransferase family 4 protein [Planctomycetota bacterium]|nr:glycosyltransferase family 4 protein [Planctomycetota bacterium]